jgi:hypothetical protein
MNVSGPKERATFSIAAALKRRLELTVPKNKRSSFVEDAIDQALRDIKKREALTAIRDFKPYPLKGPDVVETLQEIRTQREEELASRHGDQ